MSAALVIGLLALLPQIVAQLNRLQQPTTTPEEGNR